VMAQVIITLLAGGTVHLLGQQYATPLTSKPPWHPS
jgi:hypothetical protein